MRLSAERIKEAILHPDRNVRDAAVYYFAQSHSDDPTVMPLVIQAKQLYGLDAFSTFSFLIDLVQTSETFEWIIGEIVRTDENTREREHRYRSVLVRALREGNVDLQKQYLGRIQSLQTLDVMSKALITERIDLASMTADKLWEKLNAFCTVVDRTEMLTEDYEYGRSLVAALAPHREQFGRKVMRCLEDPEAYTGWLEVFIVRLAGEMKLERAIPFLADRFADEDSWACEEAYRALEMIGSESVVQELARRNVSGDWGLRFAVATTLEKIHSDLSVRTCQELLAQEPDESVQGHLLRAVLLNFCPDGIEPARQHILNTAKSLEMLEVRSALLAACLLLGKTFPEFPAWKEDSKHNSDFRRQWYEDHPITPMAVGAKIENGKIADDFFGEDDDHEPTLNVVRQNDRISSNDHAHPVSGMKFKKCRCGKVDDGTKSDADQANALSSVLSILPTKRYPLGTIACYGPNDRKITKIVAAVFEYENAKPILERWVSTTVSNNPKVRLQIKALFDRHKVQSVIKMTGNLGCPHEEGLDFPRGEDCPFCPFWAGKQGSAQWN
jgi:hypothetical protein